MHYQCLIVDDEKELAAMTAEYFEMFGLTCAWVEGAAECESFLREHTAELILLDINLKEESGFALCKKIRAGSDLPILFISARQSDDDVLIALNIGGDDYVRKPYSLSVLLAKVKIMLRRMGGSGDRDSSRAESRENRPPEGMGSSYPPDGIRNNRLPEDTENNYPPDGTRNNPWPEGMGSNRPTDGTRNNRPAEEAGNLRVLAETMRVAVRGKEVQLKAREFKLFQCLFDHRNTIVTKEQLFNTVWGNTFFSDSTLNVHIRRLREKLEEDPNAPALIKTIWGTGYIMETEKI